VFIIISNLDLFPLFSQSDIFSINLTDPDIKIYRSV
jgi:hypothetical protein